MDKYDLSLNGITDEFQADTLKNFSGSDFYLRLTHFDMHPDDSFYIEIPSDYADKTVEDVLKFVFPEEKEEQSARIKDLDVEEYGELPGLYDFFLELIKEEHSGNLVLDWSVNFGPININLTSAIESFCCLTTETDTGEQYKTLHLIVDEYETPFRDYDDEQAVAEDKKEFRGLYLHYIIANHGLKSIDESKNHGAVKDALEYCRNQNLITIGQSNPLEITLTNQGEKKAKELGDECDYYKEHYDIFASVLIEDEFVDFEADEGLDLRMAAMRYDGLNPYRANMIINQFTGVFEDNAENWEEEIQSEKFFARYLGGAAQSEIDLTDEEFERVMIEGKKAAGILDE